MPNIRLNARVASVRRLCGQAKVRWATCKREYYRASARWTQAHRGGSVVEGSMWIPDGLLCIPEAGHLKALLQRAVLVDEGNAGNGAHTVFVKRWAGKDQTR